jgi:membrane-bound lytic murein transglycosylase MltF
MLLSGKIALALAWFSLAPGAMAEALSVSPAEPLTDPAPHRHLSTQPKPWTGDFDQMLERRHVRVLVPYSRSLYFNDRGFERGLTAESVREFEKWLNRKYAKQLKNRPITVLIGPRTRERLLPDLVAGIGDIAVGNLTKTSERLEVVDFVVFRNLPPVREVVVTGKSSALVGSVDDLAGRTVHVRRASSYFESLMAVNERFAAEGKPAAHIVLVPDALEDEDLLEMIDAGILETVVVDDWKAKAWAQILPSISVNQQVVLRAGGQIGWAIRKGSPKLEAEIVAFMNAEATKGVIAWHVGQARRRVRRLKNPNDTKSRKKFEQVHALFEKYGEKYRFDPLMLTAQGFQESRLDQSARSPVGAVGVMQVMPATGNELGVGDIHLTEPNIHAGAKYMDRLMTKHFSDAAFDDFNRTLFALASYNAGPGAIARMRKEARRAGLDPDQWFDNVEIVTARRIGAETTTYVRNIYKYYAAYKLADEARAEARRAREQLSPVPPARQ